jgi:dolichyl-phosphate beta-glucosyltransferase
MTSTLIVIPCYNETGRIALDEFDRFAEAHPSVHFLFVNDGSTDDTLARLRELEASAPGRCSVLDRQPNRGKAEAVRVGMLAAIERGATYAGYWDADLATPLREIPRFVRMLDDHPDREVLFGSRVKLLGRTIERRALRHYLGRVFATVASETLGLAVYDTQCGAKLFRVTPEIAALFGEPFCTNWIFDVELIARMIQQRRGSTLRDPAEAIYEVPLDQWVDVPGSKVRPGDFLVAIWEIAKIRRRYLRAGLGRRALGPDARQPG